MATRSLVFPPPRHVARPGDFLDVLGDVLHELATPAKPAAAKPAPKPAAKPASTTPSAAELARRQRIAREVLAERERLRGVLGPGLGTFAASLVRKSNIVK
jgi:hypothetical protein